MLHIICHSSSRVRMRIRRSNCPAARSKFFARSAAMVCERRCCCSASVQLRRSISVQSSDARRQGPPAWLHEVHRKQTQFAGWDAFRSLVPSSAAAPQYPADRAEQSAIVQNPIGRPRLPWNKKASAWATGDRYLRARGVISILPRAPRSSSFASGKSATDQRCASAALLRSINSMSAAE